MSWRFGLRPMHQVRSVVISKTLLAAGLALAASLAGCGRVAEDRDASADATPDQEADAEVCIPDDQFAPLVGPGCCSGHAIQDICVATCSKHGSGCGLPHRPCCSDADTCTLDGCF